MYDAIFCFWLVSCSLISDTRPGYLLRIYFQKYLLKLCLVVEGHKIKVYHIKNQNFRCNLKEYNIFTDIVTCVYIRFHKK